MNKSYIFESLSSEKEKIRKTIIITETVKKPHNIFSNQEVVLISPGGRNKSILTLPIHFRPQKSITIRAIQAIIIKTLPTITVI